MKYLLVLILCLVAAECGHTGKCRKNYNFVEKKCNPKKTGKNAAQAFEESFFSFYTFRTVTL